MIELIEMELAEEYDIKRLYTEWQEMYLALKMLLFLKDDLKHRDPEKYKNLKPLAWERARSAIAIAEGEFNR